jgi:capsid protein
MIRQVKGSFDAAQTHGQNHRHWAAAEGLSADGEANTEARRTLRNRSRYEVANNSYAKGIVLTLANDTIGTGPRLQMLTEDDGLNRNIERDFMLWAGAIGLPEKLRTMRMARCQDGESFGILGHNPKIWHEVKLDLKLLEAEQISSSLSLIFDEREVDGIRFDKFGNAESYRVMKYHPGGINFSYSDDFIDVEADAVVHNFRQDRPGLHRGISELTPALPLFAQLRRYTVATLSAAEAAANFSGILYTDAPTEGEADDVRAMDSFQLEQNTLLAMPGGWKMGQLDPKQPSTTYAEFVEKIIDEIVRCILMPSNVAKGNSSGYNYASGRLDFQSYYRMLRVEQSFISSVILDRILAAWLREYFLISPSLETTIRYPLPLHAWFFDGAHHVDPQKEAKAQELRLKNNTTNLALEFALQGRDWETEIRQRAREKKLMKELGLKEKSEN